MHCQIRRARDGGGGVAFTIIATSDVICVSRLQLRHVMAWTELTRRRLVTSVMVVLVIFLHRVHGLTMMMVMRRAHGTRVTKS